MSGHDSSPSERPPSSAPKQSSRSVEKTPRLPVWRRAMPSSSRSSSSGSMRTFESEPMQNGSRDARSAPPGGSRRRGRPRSSGRRRPSCRSAPSRSSSAPSACVAWTTVTCGPEAAGALERARSACSRARRCTPRSRAAARRRGCAAAGLRPPRSARSPRASRAGRRGRSGGQGRPATVALRNSSSSARYSATELWRMRGRPPRA